MTSERKIWEAAILLINRHGDRAVEIAAREATRCEDDELTGAVWCWISRASAELLRAEPEIGELVH